VGEGGNKSLSFVFFMSARNIFLEPTSDLQCVAKKNRALVHMGP
jgi:hypothetical protein